MHRKKNNENALDETHLTQSWKNDAENGDKEKNKRKEMKNEMKLGEYDTAEKSGDSALHTTIQTFPLYSLSV